MELNSEGPVKLPFLLRKENSLIQKLIKGQTNHLHGMKTGQWDNQPDTAVHLGDLEWEWGSITERKKLMEKIC